MIADRDFDITIMTDFLVQNDRAFKRPMSVSLALQNITIEEYSQKLCQKGTVVYEKAENGDVKGMLIAYMHDLPADRGSYITLLLTSDKYRNQGVGYRLVEEYKEFCSDKNISYIWANTLKISKEPGRVFEKAGFECVSGADEEHLRFEYRF